jgi:hypothetical protein
MNKLEDLRNFLLQLAPGPVVDVERVERLLFESWSELDGNRSGGMAADKLIKRTENMTWAPPILEFQIERHGGTVRGSVYAGVQVWRVDVQKAVASLGDYEKRRQVGERDKPLETESIVRNIETLIRERREDPRLKWLSPTCVRVEISKVIPATYKQTTVARRRRFKEALEERLSVAGWRKVPGKLNTFAL